MQLNHRSLLDTRFQTHCDEFELAIGNKYFRTSISKNLEFLPGPGVESGVAVGGVEGGGDKHRKGGERRGEASP